LRDEVSTESVPILAMLTILQDVVRDPEAYERHEPSPDVVAQAMHRSSSDWDDVAEDLSIPD
jgi:hypothetical protein